MSARLLEIENLVTHFHTEDGIVKAVDGNSLYVEDCETLGIVGESGSGKTVTALSVMRLIQDPGRIESGNILFRGEELLTKTGKEMRAIRGKSIAMVFQDSLSSLNPTLTIGKQIGRVVKFHTDLSRKAIRDRSVSLLERVGIPDPQKRATNYPHEFSGGMRQRALIAMAISCDPTLLILDEPTTALDVTIEAQVFELVDELMSQYGMGTVLITHDLAVVANACQRVVIMYAGRIVEQASAEPLYEQPLHPYTRGLLQSIPRLSDELQERLFSIPGEVPDLIGLPEGCHFAPRCGYAEERCRQVDPPLEEVAPDRFAACLRVNEIDNV